MYAPLTYHTKIVSTWRSPSYCVFSLKRILKKGTWSRLPSPFGLPSPCEGEGEEKLSGPPPKEILTPELQRGSSEQPVKWKPGCQTVLGKEV